MKNDNLSKPKKLRQKLLMIYHEDGILDLVVGISILMLAGVMRFNFVALIGLIGIPLIFYIPLKDRVTIPRIGFIQFEAEKTTRRRLISLLLIGLAAFIVLALLGPIQNWLSSSFTEIVRNNDVLIFAVILAGILFACGQILNNSRFRIYAPLSLALVIAAYLIGFRVWIPVLSVGLTMNALGLAKLINFLNKYPVNEKV
jgi:hypothetical protein